MRDKGFQIPWYCPICNEGKLQHVDIDGDRAWLDYTCGGYAEWDTWPGYGPHPDIIDYDAGPGCLKVIYNKEPAHDPQAAPQTSD